MKYPTNHRLFWKKKQNRRLQISKLRQINKPSLKYKWSLLIACFASLLKVLHRSCISNYLLYRSHQISSKWQSFFLQSAIGEFLSEKIATPLSIPKKMAHLLPDDWKYLIIITKKCFFFSIIFPSDWLMKSKFGHDICQ